MKRTAMSLVSAVSAQILAATASADAAVTAQLADPLEWLYPDSAVGTVRACPGADVPANGVAEVNVLFNGLDPDRPLSYSCTDEAAEWFRLVAVPVERNTGPEGSLEDPANGATNRFVTRRAPFSVYDAMEPLGGSPVTPESPTMALRLRLRSFPQGRPEHVIGLDFRQGEYSQRFNFSVRVHGVNVPPVGKDSFKYTNWMDFKNAMRCHGITPDWSDAHFEVIEKYLRLAVYGRQNVMPLPLLMEKNQATGEIVLDEARYMRLAELARQTGLAYLEGPHLCRFGSEGWLSRVFWPRTDMTNTTSSIEGAAEVARLASAFADMIDRKGWRDIWYQHVADEPSGHNAAEYRIAAGIIRKYMPGIRLLDAIETPILAGALDAYCPKNFQYEQARDRYEALRTRPTDEIWCYTCMNPGGHWMNRLLDQEVLRALYLPWGCFVHSLNGYLHWGFNRYSPERLPWKNGFSGDLPAGDRTLVYPGPDGPWPSVRLEATRQGMEDLELLRLLERRDAAKARALASRIVRGFNDYDADADAYRAVRHDLLKSLSVE